MKRLATVILILLAVITLFVSCNDDNVQLCKVTFDLKGGRGSIETQAVIKNKRAIEPKNPELDHHVFSGWQLNGKKFDFNTAITEDITLCATWTKEDYRVTFNADGGTIGDKSLIAQIVEYNCKVADPGEPTKEGYTFLGWYCGEDEFDFNLNITSDLALTAKWKKKTTYTVTFSTLYGEVQPQTVEAGEKAIEPEDPKCEGATFLGWYKYNAEEEYNFDTQVTENIVLYAWWGASGESAEITLFDVQFLDEDDSFLYGTKVEKEHTIEPSVPVSKDRHKTFDHWAVKDSTTTYEAGKKIKITDNITLKAVWRDFKVGDTGPAGGIIFYDAGSVKTSVYHDEFGNKVSYLWRYLEAAPEEKTYYFGYYRTSDNGENRTVGTGFNIGEGRLSTASLVHHMYSPVYVESGGSEKVEEYAAAMCWNYKRTNSAAAKEYSDWFLPSMSELAEMYKQKEILGMKGKYWSSTEDDWDTVYYIDFSSGDMGSTYRYDGCLARPIRAF